MVYIITTTTTTTTTTTITGLVRHAHITVKMQEADQCSHQKQHTLYQPLSVHYHAHTHTHTHTHDMIDTYIYCREALVMQHE